MPLASGKCVEVLECQKKVCALFIRFLEYIMFVRMESIWLVLLQFVLTDSVETGQAPRRSRRETAQREPGVLGFSNTFGLAQEGHYNSNWPMFLLLKIVKSRGNFPYSQFGAGRDCLGRVVFVLCLNY